MYSDIVIFKKLDTVGDSFLVSRGFQVFHIILRFYFLRFLKIFCRVFKIYFSFLGKLLWNIDFLQLSKASIIIVFDSSIDIYFCRLLQHIYPNKKLILYYWNTIDFLKEKQISQFKHYWDIYSFDLNDCRKYQLKYNKLFSPIPDNFLTLETKEIKQDVFFAGYNKGRIEQILEIIREFDCLGITYKIICPDINDFSNPNIITEPLSYEEILLEDIASKAILDINYNDIYGMTMRELETIFLKKKLITNNCMVKDRDYYNENNVFIIDCKTKPILKDLIEFLKKPFVPLNDELLKSYKIESWFQRFNI